MKYRIKKITFVNKETIHPYYIAQYRIFGIWVCIKRNLVGGIWHNGSTICENFKEAEERVEKHNQLMQWASLIPYRHTKTIKKKNLKNKY